MSCKILKRGLKGITLGERDPPFYRPEHTSHKLYPRRRKFTLSLILQAINAGKLLLIRSNDKTKLVIKRNLRFAQFLSCVFQQSCTYLYWRGKGGKRLASLKFYDLYKQTFSLGTITKRCEFESIHAHKIFIAIP